MRARHPLPTLWLMTDERQGEALWRALERLPRGAGVVFRHHSTALRERKGLFARVRKVARRNRLVLVLAGPASLAAAWKADGVHGRGRDRRPTRRLIRTAPVHDMIELRAAERAGADLLFLSPVFATRSHPGERTLGPVGFGRLARAARRRVVALGGMTERHARRLAKLGCDGWAAIDALSR